MLPVQNIKLAVGCRLPILLPVADSKHKVSSELPVAGCRFNCRLPVPVADSVADSKLTIYGSK